MRKSALGRFIKNSAFDQILLLKDLALHNSLHSKQMPHKIPNRNGLQRSTASRLLLQTPGTLGFQDRKSTRINNSTYDYMVLVHVTFVVTGSFDLNNRGAILIIII
ncbi:hypothetical protein AVEN_58061-1 [Araneus ventricosus]|uniref:Uncharacterized protein n=1 Tax=Araneus ventricosus TaxID=182803 RepID=A0A4Y2S5E5_ARAVE|nr:hypothetical protein AVEN_58061-1 [Araneus ventricosus]